MPTKLLVDGDIVAYRSAAAAENEDEGIARYYADRLLQQILEDCKTDKFQIFMTGDSNFRYQIFPEYKANRLNVPKPKHLKHLQEYITSQYDATWSNNCEADDLMGIAQCASDEDTTIVSIDKDLLMIPGKHYQWEIRGNSGGKPWVKPATFKTVSDLEGMRWFYTQCLIGDTADNIKGATGVGKVGASRILGQCETEQEMFEAVRDCFSLDEEFIMNAEVLWIQRKENDSIKEQWLEQGRFKGSMAYEY